jgi:hypothetical protein
MPKEKKAKMFKKALAYNSPMLAISFGPKSALPAITLNSTINNKPELNRQKRR